MKFHIDVLRTLVVLLVLGELNSSIIASAKTLLFLSGLFGFPGLSAISLDYTRQNNPLYGLLGLFGFQSALNIFTRILCLPPFFVFFTYLK